MYSFEKYPDKVQTWHNRASGRYLGLGVMMITLVFCVVGIFALMLITALGMLIPEVFTGPIAVMIENINFIWNMYELAWLVVVIGFVLFWFYNLLRSNQVYIDKLDYNNKRKAEKLSD